MTICPSGSTARLSGTDGVSVCCGIARRFARNPAEIDGDSAFRTALLAARWAETSAAQPGQWARCAAARSWAPGDSS